MRNSHSYLLRQTSSGQHLKEIYRTFRLIQLFRAAKSQTEQQETYRFDRFMDDFARLRTDETRVTPPFSAPAPVADEACSSFIF